MPTYRIRGRDESQGNTHTLYVLAPSPETAVAHLTQRGFFECEATEIHPEERPADQALVRVRSAEEGPAPMPESMRRALLVSLGLGLAVFVILGVLFVNRAKEHLLRTDLRPNLPPNANPASSSP